MLTDTNTSNAYSYHPNGNIGNVSDIVNMPSLS